MTQWHLKSKKAPTGRKLKENRKKKRRDRGTEFLAPEIGERKVKVKRCTGGNIKRKTLMDETVSVTDPKTGKTVKTKVLSVKSNDANPHFVRRNIVTKGAVVQTELGTVRVRSRPGQSGVYSGVIVEKKQ